MDLTNRHECSLSGICGGCTYSACTYEEQLKIKDEDIRRLMKEAECSEDIYEGILGSPLIFFFFYKMEISFGDSEKNGPLTLGLHRKKSFYDIVDTDCCLITHEDFNEIQRLTRAYFGDLGLTYMDKRSHRGYLRHLLVRRSVNTSQILIDLVTTSQPLIPVMGHRLINDPVLYDKEAMAQGIIKASDAVNVYDEEDVLRGFTEEILRAKREGRIEGEICSILHTVNDRPADAIINEGTSILFGTEHITEELCGLSFKITPFSFFQTNTRSAELIYNKAVSYISGELGRDKVCFDLFSGTGTITQIIASSVKRAVGIEIIPEAVNAARENAGLNGLKNCEFICGDVFEVLRNLDETPDTVILDPPRDGVSPKALDIICSYGVPEMVYISCKPQSFFRDLQILRERGYEVSRMCSIDQFPWTKNCELVADLRRRY